MPNLRPTRSVVWLVLLAACIPADSAVLDQWKLIVSVLGFGGTVTALLLGLRQYRRAEQWKRVEFLAREMKEFFSNPQVRTALLLCDWGSRQVKLMALVNPDDKTLTRVTRPLQCEALLPHTLVELLHGSEAEGLPQALDEPRMRRYTPEQAAIRDCYDVYLDGLERFGSFLSTGLVAPKDLRPYLGYWIDDLAAPTTDPDDAAWAVCLLTYLQFYGYGETVSLFRAFGHDIGPNGPIYSGFATLMPDKALASRLKATITPAA